MDIRARAVSLAGEPRVLHRDAVTGAATGAASRLCASSCCLPWRVAASHTCAAAPGCLTGQERLETLLLRVQACPS